MGFRAVIFDLGGVVLDSPLHAIADYERELGLPRNFVNQVVADTSPDGGWARLERGELSKAQDQFEVARKLQRVGVVGARILGFSDTQEESRSRGAGIELSKPVVERARKAGFPSEVLDLYEKANRGY